MPKMKTQGDVVSDWQRLLVATQENAAQMPDVSVERADLEKALELAQEAKNRQDLHRSEKQKATQDLSAALARGKDAAIQIRAAAKFKLGSRNEKLSQFRVAPLRKRGSRKALTAVKPASAP